MSEVKLQCRCGEVTGVATQVSAKSATRVVCYCDDCQRFAEFLGDTENTLDANGGTDIYQMPPSRIQFTKGHEHLRGVRLSDKGLFRWYTGCCNTAIGNTVSLKLPFIGLIHTMVAEHEFDEQRFGPVRCRVHRKYAKGEIPSGEKDLMSLRRYVVKLFVKLIGWKLRGLGKPSPFFDDEGKPKHPVTVLDKD